MAVRTSEQLKAMFQASKERKQKERQQHKQERQQQYQLLCKQADKLLKQALQDEKKKKMEQLQALTKKTPQRAPKEPPSTPFLGSAFIEETMFDHCSMCSREALKQWEEDNWHCINWDVWDKVVQDTRRQLGIEKKIQHPQTKGRKVKTYVYDLEDNLIGVYDSARLAAMALGIPPTAISVYKYHNMPYQKLGLRFTDIPL